MNEKKGRLFYGNKKISSEELKSKGYKLICNDGIYNSHGTIDSYATSFSCATYNSYGTIYSYATAYSKGTAESCATAFSYGIFRCCGVYKSAFCIGKNGIANYLFNKQSDEERCQEVITKLKTFNYYPKYTNYSELLDEADDKWESVCFSKLKTQGNTNAWADMPSEMLEYIKSLPEFDAKVFEQITGIKTEENE